MLGLKKDLFMSAHQASLGCSNNLASTANGHCGGQDPPPTVALHNAAGLGTALDKHDLWGMRGGNSDLRSFLNYTHSLQ